jgi:hypothetical protein
MKAFSDPEVCETRTGDHWKANAGSDQLSYTSQDSIN